MDKIKIEIKIESIKTENNTKIIIEPTKCYASTQIQQALGRVLRRINNVPSG